jgi:hypothetical protein
VAERHIKTESRKAAWKKPPVAGRLSAFLRGGLERAAGLRSIRRNRSDRNCAADVHGGGRMSKTPAPLTETIEIEKFWKNRRGVPLEQAVLA